MLAAAYPGIGTAMTRRGVLFDVDGTLVDTNYTHTVAWWHAFRRVGRDIRMSDLHAAVGRGSDQLIRYVCPDLSDADAHVVTTAHTHYYAPYLEQLVAFPKAADLLRAVAALGLDVVLATSAQDDEVSALTRALEVSDAGDTKGAVSVVTSSGDADRSKPAPDILAVAMERSGLAASGAVMVGDTVWDVQACQRAGIGCIGVLSGGRSEPELRAAGAVATYDGCAALLAELDESPIGALARRSG